MRSLEVLQSEYRQLMSDESFLETQLRITKRRRIEVSTEIANFRGVEEKLNHGTGSAYDVPPLQQTFRERLIQGLDSILSRITPS